MITPPNPDTFNPRVWFVVRQVPHGRVSTYGQIASILQPPEGIDPEDFRRLGAKWVGDALNAISFSEVAGTPRQPDVPWWRIINAKGGISMPEGSAATREQQRRLVEEGVTFDAQGRTSLQDFGWDGPDAEWIGANGLRPAIPLRKPDSPRQMSLF